MNDFVLNIYGIISQKIGDIRYYLSKNELFNIFLNGHLFIYLFSKNVISLKMGKIRHFLPLII